LQLPLPQWELLVHSHFPATHVPFEQLLVVTHVAGSHKPETHVSDPPQLLFEVQILAPHVP
jgi:hypothetical protein